MNQNENKRVSYGPPLIMGAGLLGASLLSAITMNMGWPLLAAGPLFLILTFMAADIWLGRLQKRKRFISVTCMLVSVAYLAGMLLVALANPAMAPVMLPVLGSSVAYSILSPEWAQLGNCARKTAARAR